MEDNIIQNTDKYPILYKEIEKFLNKEHFIIQISQLPYINLDIFANPLKEGKLDLFNLFEKRFSYVIFNIKKTDYFNRYFELKKNSTIKFLFDTYKLYRLYNYVKNSGFTLKDIIHQLNNRKNSNMGHKVTVPMNTILSDQEFETYDKNILEQFEKGFMYWIFHLKQSNYYKIQRIKRKKPFFKTIKYIKKYFRLFLSIKNNGYHINSKNIKEFPWFFCSSKVSIRIDGHHRCGVLKHFKYETVPVLLVIPSDILSRNDISNELKTSLKDHHDPLISFEPFE